MQKRQERRGRPRAYVPPASDGVARLRRYMEDRGITQHELANHLGMATGQVQQYIAGARTPKILQALAIQAQTDGMVNIESWSRKVEDAD